jgi:polyisoprenoid-binding protein YceI
MKAFITIVILGILVLGFIFLKSSNERKVNTSSDIPNIQGEELGENFNGRFVYDTGSSNAKWTGSKKVILSYFDNGEIDIKNGFIDFSSGEIVGGEVVFDMNSIRAIKTGRGDGESMLTNHLKSADFFEAETYPEAKYVVTSATRNGENYLLKGDLTLKGETHPLEVPIKVVLDSGNILIAGIAEVNRATWNVRFGSESFFDNLGDNVINDMFTLEFTVVAKP